MLKNENSKADLLQILPTPTTGTSSPCIHKGIALVCQPGLSLMGWPCMHGWPLKVSQNLGRRVGSGKTDDSQPSALKYIACSISWGSNTLLDGISGTWPLRGMSTSIGLGMDGIFANLVSRDFCRFFPR